MTQIELLQRIKERLQSLYGARFCGLVLYGSAVRGDMNDYSDIDLLCLLDGPVDVSYEICYIIDNISDIADSQGARYRPAHIMPVDASEYLKNFPLYIEARREGVAV